MNDKNQQILLSSISLFLISSLSFIYIIHYKNNINNNVIDENNNYNENKTNNDDYYVSYMKLIGNTPMIELKSFSNRLGCRFYVKMESMNPSGTGIISLYHHHHHHHYYYHYYQYHYIK